MSPHNISFYEDFTKNIFQLSPNMHLRPKKITVSFPETSEYFLGSVGRQKIYFKNIFYIGKA